MGDYGGHEFPVGWLRGFTAAAAPLVASQPRDGGEEFTRQLSSYCLRFCLTRVRAQGHGGMMVLVSAADVPRLVGPAGLLRPKYGVQHNDLGERYRTLLTRLLARSTELEQFADLLADLMAVDGALALDKQFSELGFGVEIAAPAPATCTVYRALDADGQQLQAEAADSGGTRHRAAYRLCRAKAGCQAIVVSQDGGIRLVHQHAEQVMFWNLLL